MRRKNVNLEWYVIEHDFNRNEIYYENVFMDRIVEELIKELVKKHITNYEELKDNKNEIIENCGELAYSRAIHFFEENDGNELNSEVHALILFFLFLEY